MNTTYSRIHWPKMLVTVLGIVLLGSLAGVANSGNISTWYAGLEKPPFNPPDWLFAPVWTLLYSLMGASLYLVMNTLTSLLRTKALALFTAQLILNLSWSFIFFHFRQPGLAFLEILVLLGITFWMIVIFRRVRPLAAWLQIPYLFWLTFAALLNGSIFYLN